MFLKGGAGQLKRDARDMSWGGVFIGGPGDGYPAFASVSATYSGEVPKRLMRRMRLQSPSLCFSVPAGYSASQLHAVFWATVAGAFYVSVLQPPPSALTRAPGYG